MSELAAVAELLARTAAELDAAGIKDEALAVVKASRTFLGISTTASMRSAGRAWRLGVLLLDRGGRLFATGEVTRAIEPGRAAVNRSAAGEQRRADRLAASRGPFARGEVVNFGFTPVALDEETLRESSGPLFLDGDTVMVRWDRDGGVSPLAAYLADRLALLIGE